MHSGKLATEGRDLMMRIARAMTVQDISPSNSPKRKPQAAADIAAMV